MPVPQVNERVKQAPVQGLRAMFSAIGQLLGVSDRLRGKSAETVDPETVVPETVAPEAAAAGTAAPETPVTPETVAPETVAPETVVAETATPETATPETATPETATPEAAAPAAPNAAKPRAAAKPKAAKPATVAPEATTVEPGGNVKLLPSDAAPAPTADEPAAAAEPAPPTMPMAAADVAADLPLANYDELTIASLRARLRNLSADQLSQLIEYEKGHAGRADVITMFERRIVKIADEG